MHYPESLNLLQRIAEDLRKQISLAFGRLSPRGLLEQVRRGSTAWLKCQLVDLSSHHVNVSYNDLSCHHINVS